MMRFPVWMALLIASLTLLPTGCGQSSQAQSASVVLFDSQGQCPLQGRWNGSPACRSSREGRANALTPNFRFPLTDWGIAYAFRCKKPDDFYVTVGIPAADAFMPDTHIYRHGLSGRGFYMETGKGVGIYKTTPKEWRNQENLEIDSACAWHLRGVLGKAAVVSRHAPAIPAKIG